MEGVPRSFEQARERRIAMRRALTGLEEAVASAAASEDWRLEVGTGLSDLRAAFTAHAEEVEGHDGILADIVEDAPRLANTVSLLEREHTEIARLIDEVVDRLASGSADDVRAAATELMRTVVLHRQRGSDLIYEAYSTDIGGQSGS